MQQTMQSTENNTTLDHTQSVCPICLKVVPAKTVVRGKAVYLEKACPQHRPFVTYLWPDVDHYLWMSGFKVPYKLPSLPCASRRGCPRDCGFCGSHLRHPTLVEIEVTERCNLRCPVCFMSAGAARAALQPEPSLEQIKAKYQAILDQSGPQTSIQLTGGEPTVRKELPEIIRMGWEIGFSAIEVNTNGVVIAKDPDYIQKLAYAGISGIYMQFDGLTDDVYEKIRGEKLLALKLKAVENCRKAGVQVVLAMTIIEGINDDQIGRVLEFALQNKDTVAGIAYQPAFGSGRFDVAVQKRLTMGDVIFMLEEQSQGLLQAYDFWPLGCSHPLCSSAAYLVKNNGRLESLTRRLSTEEYIAEYDADSPQGSVIGDIAARKFPELEPGLSIVIMNYMDAFSMDLKRLKECSMAVADSEDGIVPFCSYQLTNIDGKRQNELFRER